MADDLIVAAEAPRFGALFYAGIAAGLFLAAIKTLMHSKGALNGEVVGYAIGAPLLPLMIAYAIAGRKNARNPNRFAVWFLVSNLVFLTLAIAQGQAR